MNCKECGSDQNMKDSRAWEKYLCPHCEYQKESPGSTVKLCFNTHSTCDHGEGFEEKFEIGDKIKFTEEWDAYPHAIVRKGMQGKVDEINDEMISFKMDETIEGLEEWDNCVHIYSDLEENGIFFKDYIAKVV